MTQLTDSVAEVFRRLGFAQDQIAQIQEYVKGVIKIFLAIIKNVLA